MKINTYLRLVPIAALSATMVARAAVAQKAPVRTEGQFHSSTQAFGVHSLDLSRPQTIAWSAGNVDRLHLESEEDAVSGSLTSGDLIVHTASEMNPLVALATSWTRQYETVAPTFFVQNRLANLDARRTLEHLEPELKGQNRVYCIGVRVNF